MQKEIVLAIAISLSLMAIGITSGTTIPDFTYSSNIIRPGNFAFSDNAALSGWNSFSASTIAHANTFDEVATVSALPVPTTFCGAPEEKSSQTVSMNFVKGATTIDPWVSESVTSDITVGAVSSFTNPPYIDSATGNLVGDANARYDLFTSTMGGSAGTPVATNGKLTGITDDGSRQVFSQIQSSQDDFISAIGQDSVGNGVTPTSWTTVSLAPETSQPSPYVKLNWQDTRGWMPANAGNNWAETWNINNVVQYSMYPIQWNAQFV